LGILYHLFSFTFFFLKLHKSGKKFAWKTHFKFEKDVFQIFLQNHCKIAKSLLAKKTTEI